MIVNINTVYMKSCLIKNSNMIIKADNFYLKIIGRDQCLYKKYLIITN